MKRKPPQRRKPEATPAIADPEPEFEASDPPEEASIDEDPVDPPPSAEAVEAAGRHVLSDAAAILGFQKAPTRQQMLSDAQVVIILTEDEWFSLRRLIAKGDARKAANRMTGMWDLFRIDRSS